MVAIVRQTWCWYRTQHTPGSRYVCHCGLVRAAP